MLVLTSAHQTENGFEEDRYFLQTSCETVIYGYSLSSDTPDNSYREVLRLDAYTEEGNNRLVLQASGAQVNAFSPIYERPKPGQLPAKPLHIPIHRVCLQIADRYIESTDAVRNLPAGSITSTRNLWEVLYRRVSRSLFMADTVLSEPHGYFGGRHCRGRDWQPGNQPVYWEVCCDIQKLVYMY